MQRSAYAGIINEQLQKYGVYYDAKSKHVSDEMFEIMLASLQIAYDRACRLYSLKQKHNQETQESVTTVQRLIKSITGIKTTEEQRKEEQKRKFMQKAKMKWLFAIFSSIRLKFSQIRLSAGEFIKL